MKDNQLIQYLEVDPEKIFEETKSKMAFDKENVMFGRSVGKTSFFIIDELMERKPSTQETHHKADSRTVKVNGKFMQVPVSKGKSGAASLRRQAKNRRSRK